MNEKVENTQIVLLPSNCMEAYDKYVQVYSRVLETGQPKLVEKVMYVLGLSRQADVSRSQRLRNASNLIDQSKNEAISLLNETMVQARTALLTARGLIKDADQTIVVSKARMKLRQAQLDQVKSTCDQTLFKIKTHLKNKSYFQEELTSDSRQWLDVKWSDLDDLLSELSYEDEVQVKEEWKIFLESLRQFHDTKESIEKAQQQRKLAYAVEEEIDRLLATCNKEFDSVGSEFEFIKLSIQSGQIKELDNLLAQKLSLVKGLNSLLGKS
jgi:hypothetical protein